MKRVLGPVIFLAAMSAVAQPTSPPARPAAANGDAEWTEVADDAVDRIALTPRGDEALKMDGMHWKHAQTDHFVIHFEQAIFARKVARMAEFFYAYIAQDLPGLQDKVKGRSHIFIFRNPRKWDEFRETMKDVPQWIFSQVEGPAMFLQQAEDTKSSGDVLGHETTHLVVNRFVGGTLPLWVDEGLAGYYEEFAYSAFKGVKKSRRAQFAQLTYPYPIAPLVYAEAYPTEDKIPFFYQTSKYLIAYLLLEKDASKFPAFLEDMAKGTGPEDAFRAHYGIGLTGLDKEFHKFAY